MATLAVTLAVAVVVIYMFTAVHPSRKLGSSGRRRCRTTSDCASDECCVAFSRPKGRRRRASGLWNSGTCTRRGRRGAKCLVNEYASPPNGQEYVCPCADHLTCKPDGGRDIPIGDTGICTRKQTGNSCESDLDCRPQECCRPRVRPIGRRRRSSQSSGTCQPLANIGGTCYVDHPKMCPRCRQHPFIQCVSTGVRDIPLGLIGKCFFNMPWRN
ncbi:uncharacterized protein LOC121367340 [Gigantopelta aegis]|uniref:uncharacterized protein LOC121367340 n=1 Tax=Gigantopelta aegis TaxID=1735272 RepID=UPI001B88E479|nr:uncharacterized protein LOC121367340 [Gigantopelta aegis]